MGLRRRAESEGASLPNRLLILLSVPLLAVGIATTGQAVSQVHVANRARTIERLVTDVVAVDEARRGVEGEVVPSLAIVSFRQALDRTGGPVGAPRPSAQAAAAVAAASRRIAGQVPGVRAAADAAFASAVDTADDPSTKARLRDVYRQLKALRAAPATARSYPQWLSLLTALDGVQTDLEVRAQVDAVGVSTTRALNDVAAVTKAAQYGGELVAALIATLLPATQQQVVDNRARFAMVWGTYQNASERVLADTAAPLRDAWAAATRTPHSHTVDEIMRRAVVDLDAVDLGYVRDAGPFARTRQSAFNAVLRTSLGRARTAAAHEREAAWRTVTWVVTLDALLLLLTLGLALLVRSWVTRSLRELAAQAREVSEGVLPDVRISGPKEVRTVARALAAAVVTLRGIEEQASAVAAGRVDSATLETAPSGPLGELVHASVVRVFDALRSQELAQQELAHRATHDPLTDLPNRGYAVDLLSRSLHRAQRSGAMTGVMFVDLDHFKAVNDTFGHAAGDLVLKTASSRMVQAVRDGDTVARLGGDEFLVLLEDVATESDFVRLADRLLEVLREPISFDGRELRVGASVGAAICRDGYVNGDRLMREADAALYRAKAGGRGRVGLFDDDLRREVSEHAELEAALRAAIANDEFVVYYQPVVDISTGTATGMEALIRWNRPEVGVVAPSDFIPVAESSTLINDIGRFVLDEATRQLAEWTDADPATARLTMAVNISGRHLAGSTLVDDVTGALSRSGIRPDRLIIELTETIMTDTLRCADNMKALRRLGVRIAMDDFGTGYTSIGQLHKLPIDLLKIDRSFVSSGDPSQLELCRLMVAAARSLDLGVIAEGVETEDQADMLRHMHVRACQGFLYATPQPASALDPGALVRGPAAPGDDLLPDLASLR